MAHGSTRLSARSRLRPPSGRFVLRIDPVVHQALRVAARARGLSLNDYCSRTLSGTISDSHERWEAAPAVGRALALLGNKLEGVVIFGSWVRGSAADTSDVDVLIVVEPDVALTRELYRKWDSVPVTWNGRVVEAHFAHLPDERTVTAGVWAEAALDGIVVFEREFAVSTRLARVRHEILSGRLVRRVAHGQPYWSEVA